MAPLKAGRQEATPGVCAVRRGRDQTRSPVGAGLTGWSLRSRSGCGCGCGGCTSSFWEKEAEAWAKPGAAASRSLLEPPRRLSLGAGSGPARRRTQDRGCTSEDQAGAAMVRERGRPERQPHAALAPAACPSLALVPPLPSAFTSSACYCPPRRPASPFPCSPSTCWGDIPPSSLLGDTLFFNHPQWQLLSRSPLPPSPRPLTRPSFSPLPFCCFISFGISVSLFFLIFVLLFALASYTLSLFYLHCPLLSVSFLPFVLYEPHFLSPLIGCPFSPALTAVPISF